MCSANIHLHFFFLADEEFVLSPEKVVLVEFFSFCCHQYTIKEKKKKIEIYFRLGIIG